jgi:hypothetical protein
MSSPAEGEEIIKTGTLEKLGGGEGGRQNWKKRFFVYKTKTLEYYESEAVSVCRARGDASEVVCCCGGDCGTCKNGFCAQHSWFCGRAGAALLAGREGGGGGGRGHVWRGKRLVCSWLGVWLITPDLPPFF